MGDDADMLLSGYTPRGWLQAHVAVDREVFTQGETIHVDVSVRNDMIRSISAVRVQCVLNGVLALRELQLWLTFHGAWPSTCAMTGFAAPTSAQGY